MEGAAWNLLTLPTRCVHTTWTLPLRLTLGSGIRVSPPLWLPLRCAGMPGAGSLGLKGQRHFRNSQGQVKVLHMHLYSQSDVPPGGGTRPRVHVSVYAHGCVCVCVHWVSESMFAYWKQKWWRWGHLPWCHLGWGYKYCVYYCSLRKVCCPFKKLTSLKKIF